MENITVALKVHDFECSIEDISRKLGAAPVESWLKGEIIPNRDGKTVRRNSSWIIKDSFEDSTFINQKITDLLKSIKTSELIVLSEKYLCELSVVMKCHNENNIGFNFDKEMLNKISGLGIELDIDIYILPSVIE